MPHTGTDYKVKLSESGFTKNRLTHLRRTLQLANQKQSKHNNHYYSAG